MKILTSVLTSYIYRWRCVSCCVLSVYV